VAYLVDTSLLARLANSSDAQHSVAVGAVLELHRFGEILHITPQMLIEFRNVATRSTNLNGLGLSTADAETQTAGFESLFPLLADTPDIYPAWKGIVEALGVIGKQVHDARLMAMCHVHGLTHLLTFNFIHFARLAAIGPGIVVVDPHNV
jgi:predicted nucleic acid-binding protein